MLLIESVYAVFFLLVIGVWASTDEWDVVDTRLFIDESAGIRQSESNGSMKAASTKPPQLKLEFRSLGRQFSLDIASNNNLLGHGVSLQTSGQALIGTNLRVIEKDGSISYISNPFARFYAAEFSGTGNPVIYGAIEYKGNIYRLTSADHPMISEDIGRKAKSLRAAAIAKGDQTLGEDAIVIKREIGKISENDSGVKYKCGTERLAFNQQQAGTMANLFSKKQKGIEANPLRAPAKAKAKGQNKASEGCPVNPHQLIVAVVADCNYVKAIGGRAKARDNILSEMNLVSGIFFRSYNIDITVNSVELLETCDSDKESFNVPCKNYLGLDAALNSFSKWRNDRSEEAGIYHLLTSCNYSETVGLAWMNQVCRTTSFTDSFGDTVSGTSMSVLTPNHFSVVAHELAHNLGAIHDCAEENCNGSCTDYLQCQCCPCDGCNCKGAFIMEPENGGLDGTAFSTCTIHDVCDKLPYLGSCLKEQGQAEQDLIAVCGNGIKEGQEECDCGGVEACATSPCCTADCKLKGDAKCSDSNDLCCRDCQVIPSDSQQVCRVGATLCQKDAYCDGIGASCPKSENAADGTACDGGNKCASGICTSRDTQCSIFGRHLNITEACPYTKRSCSMICHGNAQCVDMNANYVDGTPCGEKGFCSNGMCSEFGSSSNPKGTSYQSS